MRTVVLVLSLLSLLSVCEAFGVAGDNSIEAINVQFSENSCIIIRNYELPDCDLAPIPHTPGEEIPPNPCPGCDDGNSEGTSLGLQVQFDELEDALENCPYDPVLIELVGTYYLTDIANTVGLFYNQSKDLHISGISQNITFPASELVELVEQEVTIYNTTTMMNETVLMLVEQITHIPATSQILSPIIVGFHDLQVLYQNITITLEGIDFEGCNTERPIFTTMAKPERCGVDEESVCKGEYFLEEDAVNLLENGACMRTAANFDGDRALQAILNGRDGKEFAYHFTTEMTLEGWFQPTQSLEGRWQGLAGAFQEDDDDEENGYGLAWAPEDILCADTGESGPGVAWLVAGKFSGFRITDEDDHDDTEILKACVAVGQWVHLAGRFDNGVYSLFVNGREIGNRTKTRASDSSISYADDPQPFRIAASKRYSHYEFWTGNIDELRVWDVARSDAQILANYELSLSPNTNNLKGYWRFDRPISGETHSFSDQLTPFPYFDTEFIYRDGDNYRFEDYFANGQHADRLPQNGLGDPFAIPVCFCGYPPDSCTIGRVSESEQPQEALVAEQGDVCDQDTQTCVFVHGKLIDPNGALGRIWLPGVCSSSGPKHNRTTRFIPGRFEECAVQNIVLQNVTVMIGNVSITTEEYVIVSDPNITEPCFIPGVAPQQLPPLDNSNPYANYECFTPGWFVNNGFAPFWALNFVPGIFVHLSDAPAGVIIPQAEDFDPLTDLVLVPGVKDCNGTFIAFTPSDPYYMLVAELGGVAFNWKNDTDLCEPPALEIADNTGEESIPVLENELGCQVGPDDVEPLVLDPHNRDPCFVLRDIRASLPSGTELLPPENILGCHVGPDDIEPAVLDPHHRDPCFVLRELRARLAAAQPPGPLICSDGTVALPPVYMPCLKNQNLELLNSTFRNYVGERVVCQHACDVDVTLVVDMSRFINTPGTALWSSGLHDYDVRENTFCPCGGHYEDCVYLNAHHGPGDNREFVFFNNRHCAIQDLIPVECDYDLSQELRCEAGQLMCLDYAQTLIEDCQQVQTADGGLLFDTDCAVFVPCQCGGSTQNVTVFNGLFNDVIEVPIFTGDVEIEIDFLTPLVADITGGSNIFVISCAVEERNITIETICVELVNVSFPIAQVNGSCPAGTNVDYTVPTNCSLPFPIPMVSNCTKEVTVMSGSLDGSMECPCPSGFSKNNTVSGAVGSQVNSLLDAYSNCNWQLPEDLGYVPGEVCVDGIVQCPIEGAQLGGGGQAPPAPLGLCDGSHATVVCDSSTCVSNGLVYEGMLHYCDLTSGSCASDGLLIVPCSCSNNSLTISCERGTTYDKCVPTTPCNVSMPLCEITDGEIYFDGVYYPCTVADGSTECDGISYAPQAPTPAQGFVTIPCDNSWDAPGPGPCTCIPEQVVGDDEGALPGEQAPGCAANDTDCYNSVDSPLNSGDPTLQLSCTPSGRVRCRCDGIQALNSYFDVDGVSSLHPNATAYHIDHVPQDAGLMFIQNNIAQQLPIGFRLERFSYDLILNFPLKVPHFYEDVGQMHELSRTNPLITASVHDWADGHSLQWNLRFCDNGCPQGRPRQLTEACVVDSTYGPHVPLYGDLRFKTIQEALDNCDLPAVIVHKSQNPYEEVLELDRNNFWLGSYDNAVIVGSRHQSTGFNFTLRGLHIVHTNTEQDPLIVTGIRDALGTVKKGGNFTLLNNRFYGNGVNDAGVLVGSLEETLVFNYNYVTGFYTRSVDIEVVDLEARLNIWEDTTGRALRGRELHSYKIEENIFREVVGITEADDVAIVALEAFGDLGTISPDSAANFLSFLFGGDPSDYFEIPEIDSDIGCSVDFERQSYIRGNRQLVSGERGDFSTVVYHIIGGAIEVDRIRDNQATHGADAIRFTSTPGILWEDRYKLFEQNSLLRTKDSRNTEDESGDFAFQEPGSLVIQRCSFPDCQDPEVGFPALEVNPRCDFNLVDYYGYTCVKDVTTACRYGYPQNLVNITSGRARIRTEDWFLINDLWAVGLEDLYCCDKPVFYGADHTFAAYTVVLEWIEFRNHFDIEEDGDGATLMRTQEEFDAYSIHLYEVCMDGRQLIGLNNIRIADFYMRQYDGEFVMEDCSIYNWWNYPEGTVRTYVDDPEGAIPAIELPDGTIYWLGRSPQVDGFYVHFRPFRKDQTPFVIRPPEPVPNPVELTPEQFQAIRDRGTGTTNEANNLYLRPSIPQVNEYIVNDDQFSVPISRCVMTGNLFQDLDGRALSVEEPANYAIVGNVFYNCGMRRNGEQTTVNIQGNERSQGEYYFEDNSISQSKAYLFPFGGGQGTKVWHSALQIHGFSNSVIEWVFRNNSVEIRQLSEDELSVFAITSSSYSNSNSNYHSTRRAELETDDGFIGPLKGVTNPLGLGIDKLTTDDIKTPDITPEEIVGTPLKWETGSEYDSALQGQLTLREFRLESKFTGHTIGVLFFRIPEAVMALTLSPGTTNTTLFPFYQPTLYSLRVICHEENCIPADELIANGTYTRETLPANWPGVINGITHDLVRCEAYKEFQQGSFKSCAICDNGCPVYVEDHCVVDAENGTFVEGNVYYNKWLFTNLDDATRLCKDPKRKIEVRKQTTPYAGSVDIQIGNWTIYSDDGAEFSIGVRSFSVDAHDVSISGINFVHNLGNSLSTMSCGMVLGEPIRHFLLEDCTFYGSGTEADAISGNFESLQFIGNRFEGYSGPRVVELFSECGSAILESNHWEDSPGSALYMESFAYSRVFDNDFNNCGGRYENELSCVYIRTCLEVFRELVFTGNEHWRDANDVIYMRTGVDNGYVSAFWLDGLPFLNTTVVIDLTDNAAMGLPIGMRVTRADNMYGQLLYDSTPHYVFVGFRQIRMSGTWHYIVDGPPLNDQALSDDPVGTKSRYCDADCNMGSAQKSTLIVTLAVIFFILASCGGCIWFCCLPVPRYRTSYIESTGQTVPAEWSQARGYGEASARELSRRGELWPAQTRRIQQTRERTWANARETYDE